MAEFQFRDVYSDVSHHLLCAFGSSSLSKLRHLSRFSSVIAPIFYIYLHRHCSQEIRDIIPVSLRRVRTTRSSTHSHPVQVSLPNPQNLYHKSSFIPRTCNLWNVLPSSFRESYNLQSFKPNLRSYVLLIVAFTFYFYWGFLQAFPQYNSLKKKEKGTTTRRSNSI